MLHHEDFRGLQKLTAAQKLEFCLKIKWNSQSPDHCETRQSLILSLPSYCCQYLKVAELKRLHATTIPELFQTFYHISEIYTQEKTRFLHLFIFHTCTLLPHSLMNFYLA